jgi:hypothetical protein
VVDLVVASSRGAAEKSSVSCWAFLPIDFAMMVYPIIIMARRLAPSYQVIRAQLQPSTRRR